MKQSFSTLATLLLLSACAPGPPFPPATPSATPTTLHVTSKDPSLPVALYRVDNWLQGSAYTGPSCSRGLPGGGSLHADPLRGRLRAPPALHRALRLCRQRPPQRGALRRRGGRRVVFPFSTGASGREGDGRRDAEERAPGAGGHRADRSWAPWGCSAAAWSGWVRRWLDGTGRSAAPKIAGGLKARARRCSRRGYLAWSPGGRRTPLAGPTWRCASDPTPRTCLFEFPPGSSTSRSARLNGSRAERAVASPRRRTAWTSREPDPRARRSRTRWGIGQRMVERELDRVRA